IAKAVLDKPSGYPRLDKAAVNMVKSGWSLARRTQSPDDAGAWFRVNIEWAITGQRAKARPTCSSPPESSADAVIQACTQLLTKTDLTTLERALAFGTRGDAHTDRQELDLAIADYDSAIHLSPSESSGFIQRARAYLSKGQRDLAESDFASAIEVEPLS